MALTMSMRQPFANLDMDSPRLRNLGNSRLNIKNQQNALATPSKSRQLPGPDAENTDPAALKLSTKRKRSSDEETVKEPAKPAKTTRTILTPRTVCSPINPFPWPSTPKSAPAPAHKPAGRSPQIKSSKPFARRSTIAKIRGETANTSKQRVHRPFSLATALSNGISKSFSPQSQAQPRKPASWFFDIHEDSKEDEMTNLMQHSTCVLDISDDEDTKRRCDGRGKENIPPCELEVTPLPLAGGSRKQSGEKEERAPLGELNAAEYYGNGCHAFSYAVVQDEEESGDIPDGKQAPRVSSSLANFSVSALLDATTPGKSADETRSDASEPGFKIWESGSAAADD